MKIDYLRLWISNEFVNEHFLPAMNANLALSREHGAKSGRRYRHQATEADFWFWLAHYFAYHLIAPTEFRTRITNLQSALAGTTGIQRYKKLNAAIHFPLETLKKLFVQFNTIACRLVHHGSAVTIDETLIEYFGRDAKDAGIWRYIPEKPHSKGLMQWRAVCVLRHSRRRIILHIVPLLPSPLHTPVAAASIIIRTLQNGGTVVWVVWKHKFFVVFF